MPINVWSTEVHKYPYSFTISIRW